MHTITESGGRQQFLTDLLTIDSDPTLFQGVFDGNILETRETNTYDNFLPSVNAWVDISDDIVARFAYSRTVTRPQLTDLAPRINFDILRPGNLQASGGNPDLEPFISDNFDISLEWYFAESSYISVGAFYKNVENFVVSTLSEEAFEIDDADDIFVGNEAVFSVRRPRNTESATVQGLEIAAQYTFENLPGLLSGLGISANATFVGSSTGIDENLTETFALEGLGDSQNLILFYENDRVSARVAYNRREEFLETVANPVGGDPIFVKTFEQLDVSLSVRIDNNFSVFAEGINITSEENNRVGRFGNQFRDRTDTGARYTFGVRAEF